MRGVTTPPVVFIGVDRWSTSLSSTSHSNLLRRTRKSEYSPSHCDRLGFSLRRACDWLEGVGRATTIARRARGTQCTRWARRRPGDDAWENRREEYNLLTICLCLGPSSRAQRPTTPSCRGLSAKGSSHGHYANRHTCLPKVDRPFSAGLLILASEPVRSAASDQCDPPVNTEPTLARLPALVRHRYL